MHKQSRFIPGIKAAAITVLTLTFAFTIAAQKPTPASTTVVEAIIRPLTIDKTIDSQIKGGETQIFQFKIKTGQFARAEVVPTNIDVVVSLFDAGGKLLIEMDGDPSYLWRESISAIAEKGGNYKLQIKGKGAAENTGSYTVKIVELRKSVALDRKRIEAESTLVRAIKLNQENKAPESAKAYETAISIWREIGDKHWEAITMWNLAWAYIVSNRIDEALNLFSQAESIFKELNDRTGEAAALNGLGYIYQAKKDYEKSLVNYEKALAIRKELKKLKREYNTLSALISVYFNLNQSNKLLEIQSRMLAISDELNDPILKAQTFKIFGDFYRDIYKYEKASEFYEKALPFYQELKDIKNETYLRMFLGLIYGSSAEYEKAKIHLERYAELIKESGETGKWNAYQFLGMIYEALQQYDKVFPNYEKALELARAVKDNRDSEGQVLHNLGGFYLSRGQYEKAKTHLEESLKISRQNNNKNAEQGSLRLLASLYLNLREFEKAENYSEQSLAINRKESKYSEALALDSNGLVYLISGKYDKAKENYELALDINRKMEDKLSESGNLYSLGLTYSNLGQYEQAIIYYEDSLKVAREKNHQRRIYTALNGLGSANSSLSRYDAARKYFEEALDIANNLQLKREIATISSRLGSVYISLSQYDKAKLYIDIALKIAEETEDKLQESLALTYLGNIYSNLNQYDKARECYEKVLKIGIETKNIFAQYDALTNLGFVYINFNQYDKAKEYLEKAGVLSKEIKFAGGTVNVLYGLGTIYTDLNNPEKAAGLVQQSLELVQNVKNRRGEGIILNKLGEVYLLSKQYDKAQEQYEKALAIAREVKSPDSEAGALINLGWVFVYKNQLQTAQDYYEKGLSLAREVKSRSGEGWALNGLGIVYFKNKKYKESEDFYGQALAIAKEVQSKKLEGSVLWNLMKLFKELRKPQVAIVYGKQAINIFQEIRGNIKGFEKESQQSYLKDKESAYRTLADILISQERFPEAQTILDLLKEEEYEKIISRKNTEPTEILPYSQAEKDVIEKIENFAMLEYRRTELEKSQQEKGNLSELEQKELDRINDEIPKANEAFKATLTALKNAEPTAKDKITEIESQRNLTAALEGLRKETGAGAVALYTVIGTEEVKDEKSKIDKKKSKFGWAVMVTPKGSKAYPIDVKDLENTVVQFRHALSNDKYDPQPLAAKLYNAIFRQVSSKQKTTLEADLNKIFGSDKAPTIMWSLDGVLRYIPMAALHDGKQYLVEKYRHIVFTKQNLPRLSESDKQWQILGLGLSEKRGDFSALPGVEKELKDIVRQSGETTGILNGTRKLNQDFTKEETLRLWQRGAYPVIHIASHFSFNQTDQTASFLLIGDGSLTFADIQNRDGIFNTVDLLTLSACDTAMSANGKESESFAYLVQSLGAKTVIASLWKVSDTGTPELMIRFYRLRAEHPEMSKGEAFRKAQLSLLYGNETGDKMDLRDNTRAEIVGVDTSEVNLPLFAKDEKKPFAHPHYWSSFVLIGNWR